MITIYKSSETGLITLDQHTSGSWINVVNPTAQELDDLQQLGIPSDYLTYPLDLDERARTERENGEVLIVLRIPYYQGQSVDIPYTTLPLGIVMSDEYVLTISRFENELTHEMISGRLKNLMTHKRNRFVLRILLATATKYLTYLREITKAVDILEDQLQQSTRNKEVLELLEISKKPDPFFNRIKIKRADDGAPAPQPNFPNLPGRRRFAGRCTHRKPAGDRNEQYHEQYSEQHDGCICFNYLEQSEWGDEIPGFQSLSCSACQACSPVFLG